jgi:hypothetical protein
MIAVAPFVLALVAAVPQQPAAIEVAMRQPRRSSVYGSANAAL